MAGIYIHVPFCKSKCIYCDFYSVATNENSDRYKDALIKEITFRQNYLDNEKITSIYFGGGTPSLLSIRSIAEILEGLHKHFIISEECEITLEANPDDLSGPYLHDLNGEGVNRLSIGVQSFIDNELKMLKRRHNASNAISAIRNAQKAGFSNISADIIYGLPYSTVKTLSETIKQMLELGIQHISAYHLTYEEGTALYRQLKEGSIRKTDEENSLAQFELLLELLSDAGFDHYEISNWSLPGMSSMHNSAYWSNSPYLGLGPSAHSYDRKSRQWNVSDLSLYISSIEKGKPNFEIEHLNKKDFFNEYLITAIRTKSGIDSGQLKVIAEEYYNFTVEVLERKYKEGLLVKNNNFYSLSSKGIFVSDSITRELIIL